jgi:ATP-binding cassette subfamily A (ABC1) protein 3
MGACRQLRGVLWKNALLKKAAWFSTLSEIAIPVSLLALTVLLKDLSTQYDAPSIAYTCGPARPFDTSQPSIVPLDLAWLGCFQRPELCPAGESNEMGYYQIPLPPLPPPLDDLLGSLYGQLGYINFLSFTVGDEGGAFDSLPGVGDLPLENPSLSIAALMERLVLNDVVLALVPATPEVEEFAAWLQLQAPETEAAVQIYASEAELEDFIRSPEYENVEGDGAGKVAFAIVFDEMDRATAQWSYTIRANYTSPVYGQQRQPTVACLYPGSPRRPCRFRWSVPSTREPPVRRFRRLPSRSRLYGYTYGGFSTLQLAVDTYIMFGDRTGDVVVQPSMALMPVRPYQADNFFDVIGVLFGLFFMLAFIYPASRLIRGLVLEKEAKLAEAMQMMGLAGWILDLSWFITAAIQMLVTCILITIATAGRVFEFMDPVILFIWLFLFCMAAIALCFLISAFFSRSKAAATLGTMIFFGSYFPYYAVSEEETSFAAKQAMCIFAPACMAIGANVITDFETGAISLGWSNLAEVSESNFNFITVLLMLIVDFFVYFALYIYLNNVLPHEFGTQKHPLYPCQPLARRCKVGAVSGSEINASLLASSQDDSDSAMSPDVVEERASEALLAQEGEGRAVSFHNLCRRFSTPSGIKHAVTDLNLTLFEGQINVLLGPNGAGKSTTISMLTGLIPPTSGTATVRGLSMQSDMAKIRKRLGVCAQDDRLFPTISVQTHLEIYCMFKGVDPHSVREMVDTMIAAVGLKEKRHVYAGQLSGGMKRKLGLAIALIGGSNVVVLDEPTSGMDPYSRRSTWDLIKAAKDGTVVLLTTHFMDEADILADRIAIMNGGRLTCVGSSLFLKQQFGVGYTLTVLLDGSAAIDSSAARRLVKELAPSAEVLNSVGTELTFRLPFKESSNFGDLFDRMDVEKKALGISEYGVSVTKLEDVFMKVSALKDAPLRVSMEYTVDETDTTTTKPTVERRNSINSDQLLVAPADHSRRSVERSPLCCTQFRALLAKRFHYGKRDLKGLLFQLVIPAALVLAGLLLLTLGNFADISGGDKMAMLANEQYNLDLPESQRNFVPFYVPEGNEAAAAMQAALTGETIQATAVDVPPDQLDQFQGCAQSQMGVDDGTELLDMSNFLLNPEGGGPDEFGAARYGAVVMHPTTAIDPAGDDALLAYAVLVNSTSVHGGPIYMNIAHQAALQVATGIPTASINMASHPLPLTRQQQRFASAGDAFTAATFIMIAFSFIPASYAIFVVKEREHGSKHQQLISGTALLPYWAANYTWDCISYLIPCFLTVSLFFIFSVESYTMNEGLVATTLLLLLFGPASASFTYMMSFAFQTHSTAQNLILLFNFISGDPPTLPPSLGNVSACKTSLA